MASLLTRKCSRYLGLHYVIWFVPKLYHVIVGSCRARKLLVLTTTDATRKVWSRAVYGHVQNFLLPLCAILI